MARVVIRCYAELNDRLPAEQRMRDFEVELVPGACLGDALRELGIGRDEVDLVLVNGEPAVPDRSLAPGDRVAVYPVFEAFDVAPLLREGEPLRQPRFTAQPRLLRLALALRALGFDVERGPAAGEVGRVFLSSDAAPAGSTHALCIASRHWRIQLDSTVARLQLEARLGRGRRCSRCNAALAEPACPACGRSARNGLRRRLLARWPGSA